MARSSRLNSEAQLGPSFNRPSLARIFRGLDDKINGLAEGAVAASHNAMTAVPSGYQVGQYGLGDFVKNSKPSLQTTASFLSGATYIVGGWVCLDATTNVGAFRESRWPVS